MSAELTSSTKSPNIKRASKVKPLREEDVMIVNSRGMVDKPNPSSGKRPKPLKRSPSDLSVVNANAEESSS